MAKLLLVLPSFTQAGGMDRMVAALARLFAREHDVHICSFDNPGARPHFDPDAPFHPLGESSRLPLGLRGLTYLRQAQQLRKLKQALGIELSISNLWRADLVSILSGGTDRKIALAHINVVGNETNVLMLRLRRFVGAIYRRFDRVVTVSKLLADEWRSLYALDPRKIVPISNFVPIPAHLPERQIGPAERTLIWCGRFVHEKNPMGMVQVFTGLHARNPSLRLVMIGDGHQRAEVESAAAQAGLTQGDDPPLRFTGIVPKPEELMASGDMFLLTSHSEGLPMVLLEALSVGLPLAAADCMGGGSHQAMDAGTAHDPGRLDAEVTGSGVLLPIPFPGTKAIGVWIETLIPLLGDTMKLAALHAGAKERSREFSPATAGPRWDAVIRELLQ